MSKIIKLDKNLSNQIAAGEVVERPVSVIKEIVENSIDAGATQIKIEVKNSGIDEIIISDNGEGIDKDDLSLALEKYSTSKIKSLKDLYSIMTFGFRGEALASISSVSKLEIISKTNSSSLGYSIFSNGGDIGDIKQAASEIGTKIIVKDLFFNTPARLNYLKKPRTEYSHILEFLNQISLSYPNIGFEFISDNKRIFKYQKNEDLQTRIYNIYGDEFSSNLLNVDFIFNGIKIVGYISDPKVSFANKNRQALFINNRIIKSPLVYKAISDAYNRFIPHSNFPAYVINLEIDPTQIDVNVHPRKQEIRFAEESLVFRGVYHAIEDKLEKVSLVGDNNRAFENTSSFNIGFEKVEKLNENTKYYTGSGTKFKSYSPYSQKEFNPSQYEIKDSIAFSKKILDNDNSFDDGIINNVSNDLASTVLGKIIGQAHNSYIIVETKDGIKFLDQHALAERIIYERLVNNPKSIQTQNLLIGESFNLTPKELNILEENKDIFESLGFQFEIMSSSNVVLNGIPDFVSRENLQNVFIKVLDDIGDIKNIKSKTLEEIQNKIYAYTACRSAIKFGNKLNLFEMNKLLNSSLINYSSTCPHGRPVVFEISLEELKSKYER